MLWDAGEALTPSYLIESSFNLLQASPKRSLFLSGGSYARTHSSTRGSTLGSTRGRRRDPSGSPSKGSGRCSRSRCAGSW